MGNNVKDLNRTEHTTFFNDIINVKHFDLDNIKTDEESYKNILIS